MILCSMFKRALKTGYSRKKELGGIELLLQMYLSLNSPTVETSAECITAASSMVKF